MKKNKGVTLVALVVTIIILILLAGVSINLTLGENGLINKAKQAKEMQKLAEIKEKIGIELITAQVEATERNEILEQEQIKDIVSNYGELQEDNDTIHLKDIDKEISLSEIYKGTITTVGSYSENKAKMELMEKQIENLEKNLELLTSSDDQKAEEILKLNKKINELENEKIEIEQNYKKEISDAKEVIATAITNQGVNTSNTDEFINMAKNIGSLATKKYEEGIDYADGRINTDSNNYKSGYNAGISASSINAKYLGSTHICPNNAYSGYTKQGTISTTAAKNGILLICAYADGNGTCANNTYSITGATIKATIRTGLPSWGNCEAIVLVLSDITASTHTITCANPKNASSSTNYKCYLYSI